MLDDNFVKIKKKSTFHKQIENKMKFSLFHIDMFDLISLYFIKVFSFH